MTEIIVKTQAELDAALAHDDIDYDTHEIIIDTIEAKIDAPGQAWQQPRQDAFTQYSDGEIAELLSIKAGTKLRIDSGWLVVDVGEHTCGGYGPESGYIHEASCGLHPLIQLDCLPGWPGEVKS